MLPRVCPIAARTAGRSVSLLAILLGARVAAAAPDGQDSDSNQAQIAAESLFTQAKALAQQGRWAEACPKFEESQRLDRAGGTLLNLATCHEHVGRLASAWAEYQDALAIARRDGRSDRMDLAQAGLDRVQARVPYLRVRVNAKMRALPLTVRLNGAVLRQPSWDALLPVDPGHVSVTAEAPDRRAWAKVLDVGEGQDMTVEVPELELAPREQGPGGVVRSPWTTRRVLGLGVGAAGLAAIGTGAYFGLQMLSKRSQSDAGCISWDGLRCSTAASSAMSDAYRDAWIADFAFGAGAIAVVAGTYLFFTGGWRVEETHPAPALAIGVFPRAGGGGLSLDGRW